MTNLVGTTEECFKDFTQKYSHLEMTSLLAEFCKVGVSTVQRWQQGEHFPKGEKLLQLRCFLHLMGYEVTEVRRLNGEVRSLALILSLDLMSPMSPAKVGHALGYKDDGLHGLWRITLKGGGYSEEIAVKLSRLVSTNSERLEELAGVWRQKIAKIAGEPPNEPAPTTPRLQHESDLVTAFGRIVAAATSLGRSLLSTGAKDEVIAATRGGLDLQELEAVLREFQT